ncbi:MAG: helix-turn-helix transcriptional regulator [Bacteroidetes bacterium]|nr:helix-turn-helix transcriptional regulator [Bacteroidota bacterium]
MKNLIKVERARYDLSQQQLADLLGVSRQSIYAIEGRKYVPSTILALRIAQLFNLTVEDIFKLEDSETCTPLPMT